MLKLSFVITRLARHRRLSAAASVWPLLKVIPGWNTEYTRHLFQLMEERAPDKNKLKQKELLGIETTSRSAYRRCWWRLPGTKWLGSSHRSQTAVETFIKSSWAAYCVITESEYIVDVSRKTSH